MDGRQPAHDAAPVSGPLADPDQLVAWMLADTAGGLPPEKAANLLQEAARARPDLRIAVADRLFIHGLLHSHHDLLRDPTRAVREGRVAGVMTRLVAERTAVVSAAPAGDVAAAPPGNDLPRIPTPVFADAGATRVGTGADAPGATPPRLRFRSALERVAVPLALAAGFMLVLGLVLFTGAGGGGDKVVHAEPDARRAVQLATQRVADEALDREFAVTMHDADDAVITRQSLFLRGGKWAATFEDGRVWAGFDGKRRWLALPPGVPQRSWFLEARRAGFLRGILNLTDVQGDDGLMGVMAEMERTARLTIEGRGPAPGRPGTDCLHIRGERRGPIHRLDVWTDVKTGMPYRVEVHVRPPPPAAAVANSLTVGTTVAPPGPPSSPSPAPEPRPNPYAVSPDAAPVPVPAPPSPALAPKIDPQRPLAPVTKDDPRPLRPTGVPERKFLPPAPKPEAKPVAPAAKAEPSNPYAVPGANPGAAPGAVEGRPAVRPALAEGLAGAWRTRKIVFELRAEATLAPDFFEESGERK